MRRGFSLFTASESSQTASPRSWVARLAKVHTVSGDSSLLPCPARERKLVSLQGKTLTVSGAFSYKDNFGFVEHNTKTGNMTSVIVNIGLFSWPWISPCWCFWPSWQAFILKQYQLRLSPHVVVSFPRRVLCQYLIETDESMEKQIQTRNFSTCVFGPAC